MIYRYLALAMANVKLQLFLLLKCLTPQLTILLLRLNDMQIHIYVK